MLRKLPRIIVVVSLLGILFFFPDQNPLPAAVSPLLGIAATGAGQGILPAFGTMIALALAGVCLFRKRFFCRNVCPMGLLQDVLRWGRAGRFGNRFRWFGVALLTSTALAVSVEIFPSFLWTDPLALLNAMVRQPASKSALFGWGVVVLFLVLPAFWCFNLCPLGALQSILFAPKKLVRRFRTKSKQHPGPSRRNVLQGAVALVGLAVWGKFTPAASKTVRPPGAIHEPLFSVLCARCGNCSAICPTELLQPDKKDSLPQAVFDPAWCKIDCISCTKSCPSGALRPLTVEEKKTHKIGLAEVRFEHCLLGIDRECSICVRECPVAAIDLIWSEAEYLSIPTVSNDFCNGCGRCVIACPTQPKAIIVLPRKVP